MQVLVVVQYLVKVMMVEQPQVFLEEGVVVVLVLLVERVLLLEVV